MILEYVGIVATHAVIRINKNKDIRLSLRQSKKNTKTVYPPVTNSYLISQSRGMRVRIRTLAFLLGTPDFSPGTPLGSTTVHHTKINSARQELRSYEVTARDHTKPKAYSTETWISATKTGFDWAFCPALVIRKTWWPCPTQPRKRKSFSWDWTISHTVTQSSSGYRTPATASEKHIALELYHHL